MSREYTSSWAFRLDGTRTLICTSLVGTGVLLIAIQTKHSNALLRRQGTRADKLGFFPVGGLLHRGEGWLCRRNSLEERRDR